MHAVCILMPDLLRWEGCGEEQGDRDRDGQSHGLAWLKPGRKVASMSLVVNESKAQKCTDCSKFPPPPCSRVAIWTHPDSKHPFSQFLKHYSQCFKWWDFKLLITEVCEWSRWCRIGEMRASNSTTIFVQVWTYLFFKWEVVMKCLIYLFSKNSW